MQGSVVFGLLLSFSSRILRAYGALLAYGAGPAGLQGTLPHSAAGSRVIGRSPPARSRGGPSTATIAFNCVGVGYNPVSLRSTLISYP